MFSTIPSQQDDGVYFITTVGGVNDWIPFSIPSGYKNISITTIGAGGGGGGGFSSGANTLGRSGGAGGGSGAITNVIYPLSMIPSVIYIKPGIGGAGGTANTNGEAGGNTYVSVRTSVANAFLLSFASGGNGGGAGNTSTAATAGTGGTIATVSSCPYSVLATPSFVAGVNGGAGGSGTAGTPANVTPISTSIVSGGAGGGGVTGNTMPRVGGSINEVDPLPLIGYISTDIAFANTNDGYYSHWFQTNRYIQTNNVASLTPVSTNNFTIELWWYPAYTSASRGDLFDLSGTNSERIVLFHDGTNLTYWAGSGGSAATQRIASAQAMTALGYRWNHVALSRVSGTTGLYLNGTRLGTFADGLTWSTNMRATVGRDPGGSTYFNGMISNVRYMTGPGGGLYNAATLTVPTTALTSTSNTKLLTCQSSTTIDNGPDALTINTYNSPRIDGNNPFNAAIANDPLHGVTLYRPFCSTGGGGGISIASGTATNGGNGGLGSGGGGGGAGTALSGRGGRGGDGVVIISLW